MPPKGGFLSPKAIGNRIKAKGLQKLRWYCEMCQKQCRDENGFKCHQTSESHLRQMRIFQENPQSIMEKYSKEFEEYFVETLHRHHNTKRVHSNLVYKEYIADKHHVHMNSTMWATLTEFVQYLGKKGVCVVDETEKGWYMSWIDRDPAAVARQAAADKKKSDDLDDEQRRQKEVQRRIKAAGGLPEGDIPQATALKRGADDEKVSMSISSSAPAAKKPRIGTAAVFGDDRSSSSSPRGGSSGVGGGDGGGGGGSGGGGGGGGVKKMSAMEALMHQNEQQKASKQSSQLAAEEKSSRKDYWLHPGIVVKVMNKKVGGGKYYKAKASVEEVVERYVAKLRTLDSGVKIQIDQEDLETVIPRVGSSVRILNGRCRGARAELTSINVEKFNVSVRVTEGPRRGVVLEGVEYEDISKLLE